MSADPEKPRWPLATAQEVAQEIVSRLRPYCQKIEVAGSVRRCKKTVGDIEILYITKLEERRRDLIDSWWASVAEEELARMLRDGTLTKRPFKNGGSAWGLQNKFALHRTGIPVDFFRTTESAWCNYLVCRTGPGESNIRIAEAAKRMGYKWNPYGVGFTRISDGTQFLMETERDVFNFVGFPYQSPEMR
jgi:DNA polymerase (family 10)